ncbi:iron-siderophore ABC transporter substrate-binding protein [Microbacterium sp. STF-2]|uniref:iron-siderophore ABC transporter substrate-binding protein n=1 Tax=unclassified Microbacterium TaxID=2609290 RepID=UPI0026372A77|nr:MULTISPECIES: iron-siderophore ABC transporter substrate-binding protein [unclassified Microbacterium]MCV0333915.1 iron-siderophore ABC transporter substrate-binding protein [Microbacterium sp.]MCV0374557.1 iron-siderophore ABC transporter substrate-binding protein [Microbacterium sp.]MCV0389629.1 iron-siderophore ABC transporter substrate-binding protein [Microbacterium sp.]MCV0419164.1 iron-siderophore ABC transporter substrate-binding protein [Microbacterium sp.]MCV0421469.1 iron-siderop
MSHASARPKIRRGSALVAAAVAAALTLAGCSSTPEESSSASTATDGVVIEHGHGKTVIPEKPQRIVTLGWMTADIVAALGTNPVGMEEVWGAGESGYQPWFEDYVTAEYGETPEIIPFLEDGPNYEAIKELKPDLILSLYSGVSDIEYERLTEIAPTVPYIEGPWNPGTWEDMTRTVGKALSEEDKADELIAETEKQITTLAGEHPEFEDKTFVWGLTLNEGGTDLGVYLEYDPRVRITEALGFTSTPAMDSFLKTAEGDNWYTGVSLENLYDVEADLFAAWGGSADEGTYTVENKVVSRWNPIANGSYVIYADDAEASAISAPTVLSLKYILPTYVDDLAGALQGEPTITGK